MAKRARYSFSVEEAADQTTPSASRMRQSLQIMIKFRGSIYKLVWKEVVGFLLLFFTLPLIYDYLLDAQQQKFFASVSEYCARYAPTTALNVLLGFLTSTAVNRYLSVHRDLPGTAKALTYLVSSLKDDTPNGTDAVAKFSRWMLLSWVLVFRMVCKPFRSALPTLESLEKNGLLTMAERDVLEAEEKGGKHSVLPLIVVDWKLNLLRTLNGHFYIANDYGKNVDNVLFFKKSCSNLLKFCKNNIPLPLIQVVTFAVYLYGTALLMARHFADPNPITANLCKYIPLLQPVPYLLCLAWLLIARVTANPFGQDDLDVDVFHLYERHVQDCERIKKRYPATNCVAISWHEPEVHLRPIPVPDRMIF